MEKRKKKISRIYIGAGCITVLILLGVVIHGVKQFTAENADTKKGIEYIQSKENEEVKVIEQKIASLEAKDPASGDTERSLKDRFSGAVVMGDSISSGFSEYDVLNASSVVAKSGIQLGLDEQISQAKKLNPQVVFLSYGMNDVIATDGDTEAFINKYAAVIESITKEMPSVRIYINSIFPVSASAAEKEPALAKIADYNTALQEMCDGKHLGFIDNTALVQENYYEEDGIHFKAEFYPVWATNMAEVATL